MKKVLSILALLFIMTTACSSAQKGELLTTPDKLIGIWQIETSHWLEGYMIVRLDGTMTFSRNREGGSPSTSGKYWFEDNQIVFDTDFCTTPARFEARLLGDDNAPAELLFTFISDDENCIHQFFVKRNPTWAGGLP